MVEKVKNYIGDKIMKPKREANRQEYLEGLQRLCNISPEAMYVFTRMEYLKRCHNYPYTNAKMIAEKEWDKLMEKVERMNRYG